MKCRYCGAPAAQVARQRLLRHDVDYFLCGECELLQTEEPYWLEEAYSFAISQLDTGAVQRNLDLSRLTLVLALLLGLEPSAPCLDYGGGHGLFARMMRDLGLDFRWCDKYAENLYARGFDGDVARRHRLVTAIEVWEHLANVAEELERLFAPRHDFVFVATVLHEGHRPGWWYYVLETGQHISFYSRRTMQLIAERFGYDVIVGPEHTLFVRSDLRLGRARAKLIERLLQQPSRALHLALLLPPGVLRRLGRFQSRVLDDFDAIRARL
jgi:hypothetical protein